MAKARTSKAARRVTTPSTRAAKVKAVPPRPDVAALLRTFKATAVGVATESLNKFANAERERFVSALRNQDFSSFGRIPLSWRTIAKRRRAGNFSTKTLVVTGRYTDSIKVYENRRKDGTRILVGIHSQTMVRDLFTGATTGLRMVDVADYNEHGSSALRIPSRPHWWPHYMEMRAQRVPGLTAAIRRDIVRAWNKGTP